MPTDFGGSQHLDSSSTTAIDDMKQVAILAVCLAGYAYGQGSTKQETIDERSYLGSYGGNFGGGGGSLAYPASYGGGFGSGQSQYGSLGQASGFNQGGNQFAASNQHNNVAGFKNVHGYRETTGFNQASSNQFGQGFNTAAGGFNQQAGGFGATNGGYGQQFGGSGGYGLGRR